MGGLGVKVQHFPLTLLVVLTTLTLPCERNNVVGTEALGYGNISTLSHQSTCSEVLHNAKMRCCVLQPWMIKLHLVSPV